MSLKSTAIVALLYNIVLLIMYLLFKETGFLELFISDNKPVNNLIFIILVMLLLLPILHHVITYNKNYK